MVKGISRKIILVESPDKKLFEQAIFIVKDEITSEEDVLDRALAVAENFLKKEKTINYKLRYLQFFLAGIGVAVGINQILQIIYIAT